jgi:hypothetical protein
MLAVAQPIHARAKVGEDFQKLQEGSVRTSGDRLRVSQREQGENSWTIPRMLPKPLCHTQA